MENATKTMLKTGVVIGLCMLTVYMIDNHIIPNNCKYVDSNTTYDNATITVDTYDCGLFGDVWVRAGNPK